MQFSLCIFMHFMPFSAKYIPITIIHAHHLTENCVRIKFKQKVTGMCIKKDGWGNKFLNLCFSRFSKGNLNAYLSMQIEIWIRISVTNIFRTLEGEDSISFVGTPLLPVLDIVTYLTMYYCTYSIDKLLYFSKVLGLFLFVNILHPRHLISFKYAISIV